jgi:Fe-S cluster biogenesis protein NfuA
MAVREQLLASKVEDMLERLRPFLQKDDGDIELVEIDTENIVKLRFLGTCSCCNMSAMTFKASIEEAVKGVDPQIKGVEVIDT